jgi:hypothetical protein
MKKNSAAVALGRKGGLKGGPARAARLTSAERSASASKAVRARWQKQGKSSVAQTTVPDTSDEALVKLLNRLKNATDLAEVALLSDKIERLVFHKQFGSA